MAYRYNGNFRKIYKEMLSIWHAAQFRCNRIYFCAMYLCPAIALLLHAIDSVIACSDKELFGTCSHSTWLLILN